MSKKNFLQQYYIKDALIIFLLLAIIFGYFFQSPGWNENSRFDLIFASVNNNSLSIDQYYQRRGYETGDHSFYNGHYYSDKAIGPAILGGILYKPVQWVQRLVGHTGPTSAEEILTFLVISLPSAATGSLIYLLCLYLTRKRLRSLLVTLTVTLGTMYFPYSSAFFSHQLTSSLIFMSFLLIFFIKNDKIQPKGIFLFLIGLMMGWAFICEYTCAAILLPLAIYYLMTFWEIPDQPRWRSFLLPVLGALIPVTLQMIYNQLCFASPFSLGYENLDNPSFASSMSKGLMGIGWPNLLTVFYMTFHPMLGLFWQSPVLILGFAGAVFGLRQIKYRREVILAIWVIFSYILLISGYYMWWGGASLSSRHIIPILPFFCLLLVFLPGPFDWPMGVLGAVSVFQMFLPAVTTIEIPDSYISQLPTMSFFQYSYIYNYCLKQFTSLDFNENLGEHLFHLKYWSSLVPLYFYIKVMVTIFFRNELNPNRLKREIRHLYYSFPGKNKLRPSVQ